MLRVGESKRPLCSAMGAACLLQWRLVMTQPNAQPHGSPHDYAATSDTLHLVSDPPAETVELIRRFAEIGQHDTMTVGGKAVR